MRGGKRGVSADQMEKDLENSIEELTNVNVGRLDKEELIQAIRKIVVELVEPLKDDTDHFSGDLNNMIEMSDIIKLRVETIEMNMKTVMRQSGAIDFIKENIKSFNDDIRQKVDSCLRQVGDYQHRFR